MEKLYFFKSTKPIDHASFEDALGTLFIDANKIVYDTSYSGYFRAPKELRAPLAGALVSISRRLGLALTFLSCHEKSEFTLRLRNEALDYFPNQVVYPSDIIMKEMSIGSFASYRSLMNMFANVPKDLLLTAGTYLRCGMDACLASDELFIHRNTFNYRLKQFIEITNLDIRDYHNALLLELYFHLSGNFKG